MAFINRNIELYQYINERPSAQAYGVGQCIVDGVEYISDGASWSVDPGRFMLTSRYLIPSLAAANAATYTQNGTLITVTSTGHLIPNTAILSPFVYLSIGTGAAQAGWYKNFTYVDANTFTCESNEALTTSGTVNTNTALTVLPEEFPIKANSIPTGSVMRFLTCVTHNNSAATKTFRVRAGTTVLVSHAGSTTTVSILLSAASQVYVRSRTSQINGSGTVSTADLGVDSTLNISGQLSAADNYMLIENAVIEVLYVG